MISPTMLERTLVGGFSPSSEVSGLATARDMWLRPGLEFPAARQASLSVCMQKSVVTGGDLLQNHFCLCEVRRSTAAKAPPTPAGPWALQEHLLAKGAPQCPDRFRKLGLLAR